METIVTGKNQVTIPAKLARRLNIKPGTRLEWQLGKNDTLIIKPIPERGILARQLAGMLQPILSVHKDPVEALVQERLQEDREGY